MNTRFKYRVGRGAWWGPHIAKAGQKQAMSGRFRFQGPTLLFQ